MSAPPPRIAYITAGAAGMYCGSCMHDNTLVRALAGQGVDIQLIPTYTPIRTDEQDVSVDRVFFGGINVYLQQKVPLFRFLPSLLFRFLDRPGMLRWATSRGVEISAKELGALTVSMLRGTHGYQRREMYRLARWLTDDVQPQLINLTNVLIAGCVPAIKKTLPVPILATLQGDDIFLNELVEPYRSRALSELRAVLPQIDGFLANSEYYADYMADFLGIERARIHVVPLGIDVRDFTTLVAPASSHPASSNPASSSPNAVPGRPPAIGYLARLAPEKGLHLLVEAFIQLRQRPQWGALRLEIAGWLGEHNQPYAEGLFRQLETAGLADAYRYHGSVDRRQKLEFLQQIDVLSVPTVYREPKGLFVLEALAAGVPVVQPDHGAFPELMRRLGGGRLVPPEDPSALADTLDQLLSDHAQRLELGRKGQQAVHGQYHAEAMATATLQLYRQFLAADD